MSDEKGVLGNLPRSRPGRRSDKRAADSDRPGKTAGRAAERSERQGAAAAKAAPKAARPKSAGRPAGPAAREHGRAAEAAGGDPVTDAARAAAKAVGTGVRIGAGLAQEVLRRLPRP